MLFFRFLSYSDANISMNNRLWRQHSKPLKFLKHDDGNKQIEGTKQISADAMRPTKVSFVACIISAQQDEDVR